MRSFKFRSKESELMDEADISFEEFHHCLKQLKVINAMTFAYRPTLKFIRQFSATSAAPIRILDVGSGGGDMLQEIEKLSLTRKLKVKLTGVDLNPFSRKSAELSGNGMIEYATADIFDFAPEREFDVVICSLFTHHLSDAQLIDFLRWLDKRAKIGWFINDLHRHIIPYYFIKVMTFLFSRNRLIRHDAAVSVTRSFIKEDWISLLQKADIQAEVKIEWFFPFRLCVSCRKA